jgi:DNA-binding NarL/FixJ family response regulator
MPQLGAATPGLPREHSDEMLVTELLRAGARGYLLKSDADYHLIEAIKALALHKSYFTPKVSEEMLQSLTARSRHRHEGNALTARERQIVQLIAEGHTNKAMTEMLNRGGSGSLNKIPASLSGTPTGVRGSAGQLAS